MRRPKAFNWRCFRNPAPQCDFRWRFCEYLWYVFGLAFLSAVELMGGNRARRHKREMPGPSRIDVHIGARLRQRRILLGLSQQVLGDAVGLTFQQIQRYEQGMNRIGAGRLYELSQGLDVPVGYFFEGMPSGALGADAQVRDIPAGQNIDRMAGRGVLELVRGYLRIPDKTLRRQITELVKAVGTLAVKE